MSKNQLDLLKAAHTEWFNGGSTIIDFNDFLLGFFTCQLASSREALAQLEEFQAVVESWEKELVV